MAEGPGKTHRDAIAAVLVAVGLLSSSGVAIAQEAPEEKAPAKEAPKAEAEEADAPTTLEDVAEAAEHEETVIVAPGGVPLEPMPSDQAVDSVKASMARVQEQVDEGVPPTYVIEFGDTWEWIRLVSGEWLKGNIDRMRDDELEFDSDKLDLVKIDWDDVTQVHSPQINTYVFDDMVNYTGRAVITEDKIIIETVDEGTKTLPRSELMSIVEGGLNERDWWSTKLRFGFTLNKGNTDQLTYDIKWNILREDRRTSLDLNYNATFGRTDGTQNVNRHLGEVNFKVFLSGRWFVVPAFGQLLNDRFANTKLRATPAAGAGVHIFDEPNVKWDFTTGMGYQYLNYLAPTVNPQHDGFIPLYTWWDFDITGDIDFTIGWLTNLVFTTIGNTNHTGTADLAIEITDILDFDIAFLYLRTEQPGQPADPMADPVQQNDYQLTIGISLDLG